MSVIELFCHVDDFCQIFLPLFQAQLLECGVSHRQRARSLSQSEIMMLLILFHHSHYRDFKAFYTKYVLKYLRAEFPGLVSYSARVVGRFLLRSQYIKTNPTCYLATSCC